MSKTHIILYSVAGVVLVFLVYWAFFRPIKSNFCMSPSEWGDEPLDCNRKLKKGDKGPEVCVLQSWLSQFTTIEPIRVTGRFDAATKRAVEDYYGLIYDAGISLSDAKVTTVNCS